MTSGYSGWGIDQQLTRSALTRPHPSPGLARPALPRVAVSTLQTPFLIFTTPHRPISEVSSPGNPYPIYTIESLCNLHGHRDN